MIRTPIGQWINENNISNAWIDDNMGIKDGDYLNVNNQNRLFFYIKLELSSKPDTVIASDYYKTKEEAQSELDKMFNPKFTCDFLPGDKIGLPKKVYNAPKEYHETLQIIADFESKILKLSKKDY